MQKIIKLFLILLVISACSKEAEMKPTSPLIIKTTNGDVRYMVEVATTPDDMQTGLMHRTNLGFTGGMLFNINPTRPVAMWMKNTKIPLDMLFVGPDTSIIMIKENAAPMSEEHIICEEPVRAVIEINAGQAKRHGIKVGDKVVHMILNQMVDIKTPGAEAKISSPSAQPTTANPNLPDVPKLNIPAQSKTAVENNASVSTKTTLPQPKESMPKVMNSTPKLPVPAPNI